MHAISRSPTMKGIPAYHLLVQVARGVFQFGVFINNLRESICWEELNYVSLMYTDLTNRSMQPESKRSVAKKNLLHPGELTMEPKVMEVCFR